jgi:hypothetical protein
MPKSTSGFPRFNTWVDDPRWSGSASITYGEATTPELQFRALYAPQSSDGGSPQYVYISFWHKAALVGAPPTNNRVYVGLGSGAGQPGLLLEIDITTAANSAASASAGAVRANPVDQNGVVGSGITPLPAWTNDIRVWIDQVTDQTTLIPPQATNTPEPNNWAVHVRLPVGQSLGNGVTLGSPFNMWFELLQGTPSVPLIAYTWPRSTTAQGYYVTGDDVTGISVPSTSQWPSFVLGNDVNCQGIKIVPSDISVSYPGQMSPLTIGLNETNTFVATPTNNSGMSSNVDAIMARFRIANWGIQPNTIDNADPSTANWNTVRGLGAVQQMAPPAQIANGATWTLSGTWKPDPSVLEEAGFFSNPPSKSTHQCIQVELSGPSNLTFLQNSAFVNMHTVPASKFSDKAEVSVRGMPNAAPGQRDVYLFAQTANMPSEIQTGGKPPPRLGFLSPRPAAAQPARSSVASGMAAAGASGDQVEEAARIYDLTPFERAMAVVPTYILRGYYDTGVRLTLKGVQRPILAPMISFGYFIDHKGALYGWQNALSGVEQIAPNFYVARVPNNSAVPIQVSIEALEQPSFPPLDQLLEWLQWLLIFVSLLLILLALRWRHRHP